MHLYKILTHDVHIIYSVILYKSKKCVIGCTINHNAALTFFLHADTERRDFPNSTNMS